MGLYLESYKERNYLGAYGQGAMPVRGVGFWVLGPLGFRLYSSCVVVVFSGFVGCRILVVFFLMVSQVPSARLL